MDKVVAVWTGWSGGPGFSNFYFSGNSSGTQLDDIADRVRDFFNAIVGQLPNAISISVQPTVQRITEGDGQIFDEVPIPTVPPSLTGLGGASFSAPSGACVIWRTGVSVRGRLLKGKTFLVPLASVTTDTDGTIRGSDLTQIRLAASDLVARNTAAEDGNLVVWSRPVNGAGGVSHEVTASSVADRAAILRSRRA